MKVKYLEYNNLILHSPSNIYSGSNSWIAVTDFDWEIEYRHTAQDKQGQHETISPATLYGGKHFLIKRGHLHAITREERLPLMNILRKAFLLLAQASPTNRGYYPLVFDLDDGTRVRTYAKVIRFTEPIVPQNDRDFAHRFAIFDAELYSESPIVKSYDLHQATDLIEGNHGGVKYPVKFGYPMNEWVNDHTLTNTGNFDAPTKITITRQSGSSSYVKVVNITQGAFFQLNTTFSVGDVIVIDTLKTIITKNGVDITISRALGSNWIYLMSGENKIVLLDGTGPPISEFKATIEWQDCFI